MDTGLKNNLNQAVSGFASPAAAPSSNAGFLDTNSLFAKFAFIVLIVIAFVALLRIGIHVIKYFTRPNRDPMLINGQISGDTYISVSQDPSKSTQVIYRSNNQPTGMEFTWSVWLMYKGFPNGTTNMYAPVFVKGDGNAAVSASSSSTTAASGPTADKFYSLNNGPGVYFGNKDSNNTLYILMDTVATPSAGTSTETIVIDNVPIGKYFHLAVRCQNKYIDVYINGSIVSRKNLVGVPKQNYYDVQVCGGSGFQGNLSNLQYFSHALSVIELNRIVANGPNLNAFNNASNGAINGGIGYSYLSSGWYNSFLSH